ncbi:YciI family protein [Thioclava sp. GXIMD2076]|uniref:YciI family protein n=1 Tax=Thioclava kandeliae TaxID=3070818 RepID=A0ABV1SGM4_9RHOB
MFYAVICRDKAGHLQTRLDNREAHLVYMKETGIVAQAGPFIENGDMCGSLVILDTDSMDAAQAWVDNEPYGKAGLFDSVSITEWKKVI